MNIYTHEYLRMQALDKCFKDDSRPYFIDDLIIACNKAVQEYYPDQKNFKKRSIYKDIRRMEAEEGLANNIEKYLADDNNSKDLNYLDPSDIHEKQKDKRRKMAYRYKDKSKGLEDLTKIEAAQINDLINIISRIKGRTEYKGLNEVVLKLKTDLLGDGELPTILSYEVNERLEGLEYLDDLIESISDKISLKIAYQPFGEEEKKLIIFPYYLKQYNKRWILFANIKGAKDLEFIPQFAIDRINKIQFCHPEKEKFKDCVVDIEEYLKPLIGLRRDFNSKAQSVILKFHPRRYKYVLTKPPHEIKSKDDDLCTVQFHLIHNKELEQYILSFGADCKVVAPQSLKDRIAEISKRQNEQYEKDLKILLGNEE